MTRPSSDYLVGWRNPKASAIDLAMQAARLYREKRGEEPGLLMMNPVAAVILGQSELPWQTCACRYLRRGEAYAGEASEVNLAWCE